jgi:hypothetical protein
MPDTMPETPLDNLLNLYGQNLTAGSDLDSVDRSAPFLLVEESRFGGYSFSSGNSAQHLAQYHFDQEYAEEWKIIGIFDTATGEQVHGTTTVEF